ncbi:hypothetical protein TRFO_07676 [Tritrichomonas foetus]|uniref:non-specific serine/threonine protein kinase n=1 Tax=Tritrichomonas foetus TaxID=1144522 RepID=A0A1J4JQI0_9EUKA|nr:hypothetical protein TRFO_07676 [Tritrichomonas foetus]|eukprot:OHT01010.1 hypothetical protein TRFO_07676 [Tritrichomonas foetus]
MECFSNINSFFIPNPACDYLLWKNEYDRLLVFFKKRLPILREDKLIQLNQKWGNETRILEPPEQRLTIINKFVFMTVHYYFFRSVESLAPIITFISTFLTNEDRILVKTAIKSLERLSLIAKEGELIFSEPLKYANDWLKSNNSNNAFNSGVILKHARKVVKNEVIQTIHSYWDSIVINAVEGDEEVQKYYLKIIKFFDRNVSLKQTPERANFISKINFYQYDKLSQIYAMLFIIYHDYFIRRQLLVNEVHQLMLTCKSICEKNHYFTHDSNMINLVYKIIQILINIIMNYEWKDFDPSLLQFFLTFFPSNSISFAIEKKYFTDIETALDFLGKCSFKCSENFCRFKILSTIFKTYSNIEIDYAKFEIEELCSHAAECIKLRPFLLSEHKKSLILKNLLTPNLIDECIVEDVLLFCRLPYLFDNQDRIINSLARLQKSSSKKMRLIYLDVVSLLKNENAKNNIFVNIALTEYDKEIRFNAVQKITPNSIISTNEDFYSLLYDSCFKIRRIMINYMDLCIMYHPLYAIPVFNNYIKKIFFDISANSESKYGSKFASLLKLVASHAFQNQNMNSYDYSKDIIDISLSILNKRNETKYYKQFSNKYSKHTSFSSSSNSVSSVSISEKGNDNQSSVSDYSVFQKDDFANETLYQRISRLSQNTTKIIMQPLEEQILLICNESYLNKRDRNLIKSLANLGKVVESYLPSILDAFCTIFKTQREDKLLITATKSLAKIALQTYDGLNIRRQCHDLLPPLLEILTTTQNESLVISILKLFGSSFDSVECDMPTKLLYPHDLTKIEFTNFILSTILSSIGELNCRSMKAITIVFENDPENASCHASNVITLFMNAINKAHSQVIAPMFKMLTSISLQCPLEIIPMIPQFITFIEKHIDQYCCMKMCSYLCIHILTDFQVIASHFFNIILNKINSCGIKYFKYALHFLTLMILRNLQPFDIFLSTLESMKNISKEHAFYIVKNLTIIIQSSDINYFSSRIVSLALSLPTNVDNLLFSIAVFQDFQIAYLHFVRPDLDFSPVEKFLATRKMHTKEISDFINIVSFPKIIKPFTKPYSKKYHYFLEFEYPDENSIPKFVNSLIAYTMTNSPLATIRGCIEFINFRRHILKQLFPLAFLTIWKEASEEDKQYFSSIIENIIQKHHKIESILFELIQFMDKSNYPFAIDYIKAAEKSKSIHYKFFLLHREYIHGNMKVLPDLMRSAVELNKINTLKSYFQKAEPNLDKKLAAEFSGYLNDWKKALAIYKEIQAPFSKEIYCYTNMNAYNEIYDLEYKFNSLEDPAEKEATLLPFLWVYFQNRENTKIENHLKSIDHFDDSVPHYIFLILYLISVKRYSEAKQCIQKAFQLVANDRMILRNGDKFQVQDQISHLQLLYECQEMLDFKSYQVNTRVDISSIWKHRIKFFNRNEATWERMIVLRNLVMPIKTNPLFYLNIVSCLRKAGYLSLIDYYFKNNFDYSLNGSIVIEMLKITLASGQKDNFFNGIKCGVSFISFANKKEHLYAMIANKITFPFTFIYQLSQQPAFDSEVQSYISDYFDTQSFSNALNFLHTQSFQQQYSFLLHLCFKFPQRIYSSHLQLMVSDVFTKDFFFEICFLYAKYNTLNQFNSFSCFRTAAKYIKAALNFNPNNAKAWKWLAFSYMRLFSILNDNPNAYLEKPEIDDIIDFYERLSSDELQKQIEGKIKQLPEAQYSGDLNNTLEKENIAEIGHLELSDKKSMNHNLRQYIQSVIEFRKKIQNSILLTSNPNFYGVQAIVILLKVIRFYPSNTLEHLCQLFSVLFTMPNSELLTNSIIEEIIHIPSNYILKMIPQITAHMNHPDKQISEIAHQLLFNVGIDNFQDVFFPLNLYKLSGSTIAENIIENLTVHNVEIAADARLFADGMIRSSSTWFEEWKRVIEIASRNQQQSKDLLQNLFDKYKNPCCELDSLFIASYGHFITKIETLFHKNTEENSKKIWMYLNRLHASLQLAVSKLCNIILNKISESLASKRGFTLRVPGGSGEMMESIESVMEILGTQQRPRSVFILGSNGERTQYLLKGNEDLRLDERIMQFFALINTILRHSRIENLQINDYQIIPLSKNAGLIIWVTQSLTMHQAITNYREVIGTDTKLENKIDEEFSGNKYIHMNSIQKIELFEHVAEQCKATELFEMLWRYAPSAVSWISQVQNFTSTTALMSMVGYIIGLGDRHPSNILLQKNTGRVIHIDFGETFESTIIRKNFPEKVPFRLTRILVNTLEGSTTGGYFWKMCVDVMKILRKQRATLAAQLVIFFQEPMEFDEEDNNFRNKKTMDRILTKLEGSEFDNEKKQISVEKQVQKLIDIAADYKNYCRHYLGWCPFW